MGRWGDREMGCPYTLSPYDPTTSLSFSPSSFLPHTSRRRHVTPEAMTYAAPNVK
jgi:hypothetical protein